MNTPAERKSRQYSSVVRAQRAEDTRRRIIAAATSLFGQNGIDAVTIAEIGEAAGVAGSTVYAVFKSKDGVLRAIMKDSLFGGRFQEARQLLDEVTDPVEAIAATADVAVAIHESENTDLGLVRYASGFSPELRNVEQEFENLRYSMQESRIQGLVDAGRLRAGLTFEEARRLFWMYTSRDVYRMLVHESGWTPDRYREWLRVTLVEALVETEA